MHPITISSLGLGIVVSNFTPFEVPYAFQPYLKTLPSSVNPSCHLRARLTRLKKGIFFMLVDGVDEIIKMVIPILLLSVFIYATNS